MLPKQITSHASAGIVGALLAVLAVLGFASPSDRIKAVEAATKEIKEHISNHDVEFATVRTEMKYMSDGIDDLRESLLGREPRRRRANR
jgi:hypothetical protein